MFSAETYSNRRLKLSQSLTGGIVLLLGNTDLPMNYPGNTYRFRQDSSFLYFFGIDLQNLCGVIDIDSKEEILFGDDIDIEDIVWMGPQESIANKAAKAGIKINKPYSELSGYITKAIAAGRKVHFLPPYRAENKILLSELTNIPIKDLKANASVELIKGVVALREIKEDVEIAEIEKACVTGYKMHIASMVMCKPGKYEHDLAGVVEGIALGADGQISFPVILSQNGETLHNHDHSKILEEGRLMITDAGAETAMHYASDYTRTVPVSGKFSPKQKGIYDIVVAANDKATSMAKPDIMYKEVHLAVCEVIAEGLKELGLMKGNVQDAVAAGAHGLFFVHGLGHAMGLDVHDMEDIGENYVGYDETVSRSDQFGLAYLRMAKKLRPGMVITNEPGIYFIPVLIDQWQKENLNAEFINYDKVREYIGFGGIRLEDDILITEDGCRILGKRLPIYAEEIEGIMAK
ncbi:MAG: aminopeptidase P family protein [bacterium]